MLRIALVVGGLALGGQDPPIVGTWKVIDAKLKTNGPREVVIRADSSASWGQEYARWRLIEDGKVIMIAIGGVWEVYDIRVRPNRLTLSGGDLPDPITLSRTGPATPRPEGVPVPPDPGYVPPSD